MSFLIDVPIPSMGATVNEMTLIDLEVEAGQEIAKGEKIAELESDKSVFDFEAPCDGVVRQIHCRAGDILEVGAPFVRIETEDTSVAHLTVDADAAPQATSAVKEAKPEAPPAAPVMQEVASAPLVAPVTTAPLAKANGIRWTPRAKKLALERGFDPESMTDIVGTGPGGRVTGDDLEAYVPAKATVSQAAAVAVGDGSTQTACVAGIGYAVPQNMRSNAEILKQFPGKTEEEIVKVTGIQQRYVISEGESATSLASKATRHALKMAGLEVSDIDAVVVATLLPDHPVPGAASILARELGVESALAFDLNAACSGWLYALEVGRSLIYGGTAKNILVVTAEILSRITNPKDHETAFLFGDGAGAAILTKGEGGHRLHRLELSGDARFTDAISRTGGGALKPMPSPGEDLDSFYLKMDGGVVFKRAVLAFSNIIESALERHGLKPDDVSWIVPHQANARILRAVSKRVGIPYEKFVVTINKYGNTSAASVSMALGWAAEEEIFEEGDKIIFCSVGAGFTFAGGLMTW
ncbi:beta-ketoacyl-ACP synthase 3 [Pelagicoccus sp. NFK12]|uniref:Beta-ketoacyl-ACP synthase 3 n=1 Tax=Pelagicoccus enzymogenes TaxID=2773457 RepID=A0A927FCH9_9BACT|nr:beta-ketoacyl-ACP synthase 3 [Pelagicoccus enzymogenes]MBD5782597.1 beta-ketoacyl-ACP synthase 3 [Pelagicoccus enzymogenes]MDQ8199490.1 beta-ketoacyl-ACP synthase 3 [Pelagicoccus enzymogenes]